MKHKKSNLENGSSSGRIPGVIAGRSPRSHQAVLDFLRTYRDPRNGLCTPTKKEIAAAVGLAPATVSQITRKLAKSGRIEKTAGWEYCVDGDNVVFTTDRWEAEGKASYGGTFGAGGDWWRGPNIYRIIGVLLIFVLLCPTLWAPSSMSAEEVLCYKTLLAILVAHLAKQFSKFRSPSRLEVV